MGSLCRPTGAGKVIAWPKRQSPPPAEAPGVCSSLDSSLALRGLLPGPGTPTAAQPQAEREFGAAGCGGLRQNETQQRGQGRLDRPLPRMWGQGTGAGDSQAREGGGTRHGRGALILLRPPYKLENEAHGLPRRGSLTSQEPVPPGQGLGLPLLSGKGPSLRSPRHLPGGQEARPLLGWVAWAPIPVTQGEMTSPA